MTEDKMVTARKITEWSLSSIVGNLAWVAVLLGVPAVVGYFSGTLDTVLVFASAHAKEAASWSAAFLLAGALIGSIARHRIAIKQLAAKDDEIADLEKRPTKEQLDAALAEKDAVIAELRETASLEESHRQFLAMSWHAQVVCLAAFSGSVEKATDGIDDETPNPYRAEARDAGFVFVEACGIGKWRTVPTEKLVTLMAEKPEVQQKVWEGVHNDMIGGCADEHEVSWKDVILIEGLGAVFPPKDAEEGQ